MLVTVPMLSHKVILDLHQTGPAGPHPQVQLLGCSVWVTLLAFSSWRQQQSQGMHIHKHTYIDTADGTRGDCRLYEYISLLIFTCFFFYLNPMYYEIICYQKYLTSLSDISLFPLCGAFKNSRPDIPKEKKCILETTLLAGVSSSTPTSDCPKLLKIQRPTKQWVSMLQEAALSLCSNHASKPTPATCTHVMTCHSSYASHMANENSWAWKAVRKKLSSGNWVSSVPQLRHES